MMSCCSVRAIILFACLHFGLQCAPALFLQWSIIARCADLDSLVRNTSTTVPRAGGVWLVMTIIARCADLDSLVRNTSTTVPRAGGVWLVMTERQLSLQGGQLMVHDLKTGVPVPFSLTLQVLPAEHAAHATPPRPGRLCMRRMRALLRYSRPYESRKHPSCATDSCHMTLCPAGRLSAERDRVSKSCWHPYDDLKELPFKHHHHPVLAGEWAKQ